MDTKTQQVAELTLKFLERQSAQTTHTRDSGTP